MEFVRKIYSNNTYVYWLYSVLTLVVFGVVLTGGFVFDDTIFVQANTDIRSLSNFFQFFVTSPVSGAGLDVSNFYRPLQTLAYALMYSIVGLTPFFFHLLPLVLHTINALLTRKLLQTLRFSALSAFIGGIIFLIHPAQLEAVSYISGLADPLALFFFFLALFSAFKQKWTSLIWLVLAFLSKEWVVVFLPLYIILTAYQWPLLDESVRRFRKLFTIPASLITLAYLILKFTVLDFTGNGGLAENVPELGVRLVTFVSILWEYIKILFFPLHLYIERPYEYFYSLLSFRFIFGALLIALVVTGITLSMRKDGKLALGLLWMSIAIFPYTNIIPLNAIYLEHWLYVAMIGFCIILATLVDSVKNKRIVVFVFLILSVLMITRDIQRNLDWANIERFYIHELSYTNSSRIHNNIAMHYAEEKKYDSAIKHYNESLVLDNSFPQTHHNLAQTYLAVDRYEEAESGYKRALSINPNFLYSYVGLYNLYIETGEVKKAQEMLNVINSAQ